MTTRVWHMTMRSGALSECSLNTLCGMAGRQTRKPERIRTADREHGNRRRARALPPGERRALIIRAVIDLLVEKGAGVTTRQIADRAGVAEGTIFGVFTDKAELMDAVVEQVFDPDPLRAAISRVDLALPLEERLSAAVVLLQDRVGLIWRVMSSLGMTRPPEEAPPTDPPGEAAADMRGLAGLLEPDAERLRYSPTEAARLLRALTFACTFPLFVGDQPRSPEEIVSIFLDGLRRRDDRGGR